MRHKWTYKHGEIGRRIETCRRCGAKRLKTAGGYKALISGERECRTPGDPSPKEQLGAKIDRTVKFFAVVSVILFLASCCPARNADGNPWPPSDVLHRVFAGKGDHSVTRQVECVNVKP